MKSILSALLLLTIFCLACGEAEVAPTPTPGGFATIADPQLAGTYAAVQATRFAVNTQVAASFTAQAEALVTPGTSTPPPPTTAGPSARPTSTRIVLPTVTPDTNASVDAAFAAWLSTTVCAPGTAANPRPAWCDQVKQVTFPGDTLTLRTTVSAKEPDTLRLMVQRLSAFVFDARYVQFKLANIVIVSDGTGAVLARRRGLAGAIEVLP